MGTQSTLTRAGATTEKVSPPMLVSRLRLKGLASSQEAVMWRLRGYKSHWIRRRSCSSSIVVIKVKVTRPQHSNREHEHETREAVFPRTARLALSFAHLIFTRSFIVGFFEVPNITKIDKLLVVCHIACPQSWLPMKSSGR